jgi:hypothetical protein
MLIAGVVRHPVEEHADAASVGVGEQAVEVREGAEERIDVAVVGDVVAVVLHRRAVEGREPEGIDAEPGEMVEPPADALEIANAVAVSVAEAPRINLVDDGRLPPGRGQTHPSAVVGSIVVVMREMRSAGK